MDKDMTKLIFLHLGKKDKIRVYIKTALHSGKKYMVLDFGNDRYVFPHNFKQAEELAFAINSALQDEGIRLREKVVKEMAGEDKK